ncbi:hemerythrin domain-containing protein [Modestobacter sp. SYSU DS0290]
MTAAVLPRPAAAPTPDPDRLPSTAAVAYQRVLHGLARRELRLLAELTAWAPADDAARAAELAEHADLVARVVVQHHATERDLLWPLLLTGLPDGVREDARGEVQAWSTRAALIDQLLRELTTAGRQWAVAGGDRSQDVFAAACTRLAAAVGVHTAAEERALLPLVATHLTSADWAAISRAAGNPLSGREQMFVLGLALEDACAGDRARLMVGLPRAARTAWRLFGRRDFRAAVVRLRGAPPAA